MFAGTSDVTKTSSASVAIDLDVIVVGAGFGGLYALHTLRASGLSVCAYETAADVGGVWYWNRYPGARCDVESMQYSFSFDEALQQEWHWSERFAAQPEILAYANHVADRYDLRNSIRFKTRITAMHYNEAAAAWSVHADDGSVRSARFVVMATGCLSETRTPEIPGVADFAGPMYHTGAWPHDGVAFSGQRVGVIGTGSSGIQVIPEVARQAGRLFVFQRTANFSIPARNVAMDDAYEASWKTNYAALRKRAREETTSGTVYEKPTHKAFEVDAEVRRSEYERRWQAGGVSFMHSFSDLATNRDANQTAADFVREQIRVVVRDPRTAELLVPKDHPIGTKRICIDTEYFETYNRDNVELVDVRSDPIGSFNKTGVVLASGRHVAVDCLVFATGYDAMTGALARIDVRGKGGMTLTEAWAGGPRTYLGLCIAGFPNFFTVTGPGSPSVLSNMIFAIEQHIEWIVGCIGYLRARNASAIEADATAQDAWVAHVNEVADKTLFPHANSWYVGANVPGKPRVFMPYIGGVVPYRQRCDEVAANGYDGFVILGSVKG